MSSHAKPLNRREFLQNAAAAGAAMCLSPLARLSYAQSPSRNRVTVAHGVGVYSLNPYAVTTSPYRAPGDPSWKR